MDPGRDALDRLWCDPILVSQSYHGVDEAMVNHAAGIGFQSVHVKFPILAQASGGLGQVVARRGHRWEPAPPFQDGCASGEAPFGQKRRQHAGLGGPARVEGFGHGTEHLPHSRRLGARNPHGLDHLPGVQPQQPPGGGNRAEHAAGAGDVPTSIVMSRVDRHANSQADFHSQHRGRQDVLTAGAQIFAHGKGGGDDWG